MARTLMSHPTIDREPDDSQCMPETWHSGRSETLKLVCEQLYGKCTLHAGMCIAAVGVNQHESRQTKWSIARPCLCS